MVVKFGSFVRWLVALAVLGAALRLIFQPDPRDGLRAADLLFTSGRYHEALERYAALAPSLPVAQLRLGMVRTLRGERNAAERALYAALQRGLAPTDAALAHLYLGRALTDAGRSDLAERRWQLLEPCRNQVACVYRAAARILAATAALHRGDTQTAATGYRAALTTPLPPDWAAACRYGLALLIAPDDADAARALLAEAAAELAPADALLAPLLPPVGDGPGRLAAVLAAEPTQRSQLLGQFYLDLNLYGMAEAQFARVDPQGPHALSAAAYAAYARWRAGDAAAGQTRLLALVAAYPDEPRIRSLLVLAYLTNDASAARDQLEALSRLSPGNPAVELVWASWYAAQHDYEQASLAYERALKAAAPAEQGSYALVAARFYLATTYELCVLGLPRAELAAHELPDDATALTTVAAQRYYCGQFAGAVAAARTAQQLGAGPEASYYLGTALAALGEREAAKAALLRAADLAPASEWCRRAELALGRLP